MKRGFTFLELLVSIALLTLIGSVVYIYVIVPQARPPLTQEEIQRNVGIKKSTSLPTTPDVGISPPTIPPHRIQILPSPTPPPPVKPPSVPPVTLPFRPPPQPPPPSSAKNYRLGVVFLYSNSDNYDPDWRTKLKIPLDKAIVSLNTIFYPKVNFAYSLVGEVQTKVLDWNPAKVGLISTIEIKEIANPDTPQASTVVQTLSTPHRLPASKFSYSGDQINSSIQRIVKNGILTELQSKSIITRNDCTRCTVTTTDRTDEFKNLFPSEGFIQFTTISVNMDLSKIPTGNKPPLLDSEIESRLAFRLTDYDGVIIVFGRFGKVLPENSKEDLDYRCYLQVEPVIAGYSNLMFGEYNLLAGEIITCPNSVVLYDNIGFHSIVHEILHRFGAVDVYHTNLIYGITSYRDKAITIDPKTDESILGDDDKECIAKSNCTMEDLERIYIDKYNQSLVDAYLSR